MLTRKTGTDTMEPVIVRIGLALYLAMVIAAVFLLWRNAAAPDAVKNTGIVVASILPVLFAVLPYLTGGTDTRNYTAVIFYDSQTKSITTGDRRNAYSSAYGNVFTNISSVIDSVEMDDFQGVMYGPGLDLIEKGVIVEYATHFMGHWDLVTRRYRGPNYRSTESGRGSELPTREINMTEVRQLFPHNAFISAPDVIVMPKLVLPPHTDLTGSRTEHLREIVFRNSEVELKVSIRPSSGGVAQQGVWGIIEADPEDMNRFYSISYRITIEFSPRGFNRHSPKLAAYQRWYENFSDQLSGYDWESVDQELEHSLTREAIDKTLQADN